MGTDCLVKSYFPTDQPTMNFGWLQDNTSATEYRRVVVHEFGHAIGCIHEHQSPTEQLKWDKAAVYAAFSGPPNNWSAQTIDRNMFEPHEAAETNFTKTDRDSIMMYPIKPNWTLDGFSAGLNSKLSATDRQFIHEQYP